MRSRHVVVSSLSCLVLGAACGGSQSSGFFGDGGTGVDGGHVLGSGTGTGGTLYTNSSGMMLTGTDGGQGGGSSSLIVADPTTCAQAAMDKSYVGCDYWPTVTANLVESVFDFTAVVANTQTTAATVTVTGPNGFTQTATVPASGLTKIYLPWVAALKGPDVTQMDSSFPNSVSVPGGAYHLVSSVPVTVYQFNALEYKGQGGAPGKDWSQCVDISGTGMGCFSYSNDASVLIPSTAMTGNYRVTGEHGSTELMSGGVIAVTGTVAGTNVTVTLSPTAETTASTAGDIAATGANKTVSFMLNAGDVVELMGVANDEVDLSGSLVQADQPVQVIAGRQCANQPDPIAACDHLESSVLPAETLGTDYVVTVPTSPHGAVIGHKVRFFGNVNDTALTYSPSQPTGCPSTLNAGEVVECLSNPDCATGTDNDGSGGSVRVACTTQSFEVTGTHEFAVSSFMLGGSAVDPGASSEAESEGDPSMSPMVAVEQFRTRYIFLAPTDYDESYADVVIPTGGTVTLDGAALTAATTPLNASWGIVRVPLTAGQEGAHLMIGSMPFGVQVIGYGAYTSYQYPAGLDLAEIAPPPPPPPGLK